MNYFKTFTTEREASEWMKMKNQTNCVTGLVYCLMDGPENNFVVCDNRTAIESGMPYSWDF